MTECLRIDHSSTVERSELINEVILQAHPALGGAIAYTDAIPFAHAERLKLGNEGVYAPFSMMNSQGTLVGVEPDLAREMCKRMGAECEFMVMEFKALIPSLLQGKFDALVFQPVPLPERKERALFSIPLLFNFDTFVVPASADYHFTKEGLNYQFTKEGLKGVRIELQRGGAQTKWLLERFGETIKSIYYNNPDEIRLDLLARRIDITFGPSVNWKLTLIDKPEGKNWKLAGGDYWSGDPSLPPAERGRSWLVKKGDDALLARMNAALKSMMDDCTFTQIRKRYISFSLQPANATCEDK